MSRPAPHGHVTPLGVDNARKRSKPRGAWQPRLVALAVACWVLGLITFIWLLVLASG